MKSHTVYRTFNTEQRRELVRITEDVQAAVDEAGHRRGHGAGLGDAHHRRRLGQRRRARASTRTRWSGSTSWRRRAGQPPSNDVAEALLPEGGDYRHHRGGEDNGDAHLKNLLVHHQAILPVTEGRLDLGPWQQVFYCEFDGRRPKRLVIKVIGE